MDELLPVWEPCVEVRETPEGFLLLADLPGIDLDGVEVLVQGGRLVISGEREPDPAAAGERIHVRGRRYGTFGFALTLPRGVDGRRVSACLHDGVLTVRLPKAHRDRVREVPVSAAGPPRAVDGVPRSTPPPQEGSCPPNPVPARLEPS